MLTLTPIDQTVAGQQIYERGFKQGLVCGRISGLIHFSQRLLKQPLTPKEELAQKTEEELQSILQHWEAEMKPSLRIQ